MPNPPAQQRPKRIFLWSWAAAVSGTLALLANDYLYATRGMETSLFIFMCLLAIHLFEKVTCNATSADEKPGKALAFATGLVWALAVFIRGEAVLIGLFPLAKVLSVANQRRYESPKLHAGGRGGHSRSIGQYTKRAFPNLRTAVTVISLLVIGCFIIALPITIWLETQTGSLIPITLKAKEE